MKPSVRLKDFLSKIQDKIENSQKKSEKTQWNQLSSNIINSILQKLQKENLQNDIYQSYIFNCIDLNKNIIKDGHEPNLSHADTDMNSDTKLVMFSYFDIMNESFEIKDYQKDINISRLYLYKLMIPIMIEWKNAEYHNIYRDINELSNIVGKHSTYKYHNGHDIIDFFRSIIFSNTLLNDTETLKNVFTFVNTINTKINNNKKMERQ
jgi:hypothetical protein